MKKWVGPCLSLLLVLVLLFLSGPVGLSKQAAPLGREAKDPPLALTQDRKGNKGEEDSQFIQVLKGFQEIVDGWLKSLNERIEKKDETGFEVRFLEILRNILEWVKEKIDGQIESMRREQQRRERGKFREVHWKGSPFSSEG